MINFSDEFPDRIKHLETPVKITLWGFLLLLLFCAWTFVYDLSQPSSSSPSPGLQVEQISAQPLVTLLDTGGTGTEMDCASSEELSLFDCELEQD